MKSARLFIGLTLALRLVSSSLDTHGKVRQMYAELSGSSEIRDYDLAVDQLNIELTGASEAFLSVNGSIAIEASGASVLNYKGNAVITRQELSGASEIKNRNHCCPVKKLDRCAART